MTKRNLRSYATEMASSTSAEIRARHKNMCHRLWNMTARAQWPLLATKDMAVCRICVADTQPAEHNLLLPVPPRARPPRFEGRLDLPKLARLRIPLLLPLGLHEGVDRGTEAPCRKRKATSAWRTGRASCCGVRKLVAPDTDVTWDPTKLDGFTSTIQRR